MTSMTTHDARREPFSRGRAGDAPRPDLARRLEALRSAMAARGADLFVTSHGPSQAYFTRFHARNYSRPIFLLVSTHDVVLVVPRLEESNASRIASFDRLIVYDEQPHGETGFASPGLALRAALSTGRRQPNVALEFDHCPHGLTLLIAAHAARVFDVTDDVVRLRSIKDAAEIAVITSAARLAEIGVRTSLRACSSGVTEIDVDAAGSAAVARAASVLGPDAAVEQATMSPSGPERSALPHTFSTVRRLEAGDGLIHTRHTVVDGYRAELERTAFVDRASPRQQRAFQVMRDARDAAVEQLRHGARCCDVDQAAQKRIDGAGLRAFAPHRTGHGIGLGTHEAPYIRYDNSETLEAGMVVTIEPGLYVPGLGGFRHSDTFLICADGARPLTSCEDSLDELILPSHASPPSGRTSIGPTGR